MHAPIKQTQFADEMQRHRNNADVIINERGTVVMKVGENVAYRFFAADRTKDGVVAWLAKNPTATAWFGDAPLVGFIPSAQSGQKAVAKPEPKPDHRPEPKSKPTPTPMPTPTPTASSTNTGQGTPRKIRATPYVWRDPSDIPPREWLYGKHLIRRYISATFAPGGVGKSSLLLAETIAMATGRDLLKTGHGPLCPLKIWYWNGEDPAEETERRIAAILLHYDIHGSELERNLFIDSGREVPIEIATEDKTGAKIAVPIVNDITEELIERQIDVMIIDPFVSCHSVNENDNNKIDMVVKRGWGVIAEATNSAIELVHHTRKAAYGQYEQTVDDGRGASALKDGARSSRILNVMSKEEATKFGLEGHSRSYFKVEDGKPNMAKSSDFAAWHHITSVDIGNQNDQRPSDDVGVVVRWTPPNPFDGVTSRHLSEIMKRVDQGSYRKDIQARDWVGKLVAEVIGLDLDDVHAKAKVKALVKQWLKAGALKEVDKKDAKGELRPFITAGSIIDLEASAP